MRSHIETQNICHDANIDGFVVLMHKCSRILKSGNIRSVLTGNNATFTENFD